MPDRQIVARLRAEAAQFLSTMGKAAKSTEQVGESADKSSKRATGAFDRMAKSVRANSQHIDRLGNSAIIAGGAITAGLGLGIKAFADFDEAMSSVNAALPEAGAQMENLRQLAINLGKDSKFSSTEAAQGITELAKAGVSAEAILGGGLKGSLDLAASGQLAVADAAEIAATAMVQFKLKGEDVPHIADLLAAGAGKAQGSVTDLGAALNQAGLIAAGMGLSIEETTGGLAAFASAGLVGSDAGTSFKTMIQRLQAPVGDAALMLDKYNISAYDAQGNFVGLANVAGQLNDRFKDLTPEVRNNALAVIFGSDAVRGANVLYEQGATGISKWVGAVNDAGFAAEQAAKLTDNLKGDIERLGGALDAVFVQNGEGANGALRSLTQGLEGAVESFGRLPEPAQQTALGLAAVTGATLLAFGALAKGVTAAAEFGESLDVIRTKSPKTAKGIDLTTKAMKGLAIAGAALTAASALSGDDDVQSLGVQQLTRDLLDAGDAMQVLNQKIEDASALDNLVDSEVKSFGDALRFTFDPGVGAQVDDIADSIGAVFGMEKRGDMAVAAKRLGELDSVLAGLVSSGNAAEASRLFAQMVRDAKAQGVSVEELKKKYPQYAEAIAAVDNQQRDASNSAGDVATKIDDVAEAAEAAETKVDDLAEAIRGFGQGVIDAEEAEANFRDSMADAIETAEKNAKAVKDGEMTKAEAARENAGALRDAAVDAKEYAATTLEVTGSASKAQDAMQTGRDEFIKTAVEMGKTKKQAKELADRYGLLPEKVVTTVKANGAETARTRVQNLIDTIKRLNSKTVDIGVRYTYSGTLPNGGRNQRGGQDAGTGGRDYDFDNADGGMYGLASGRMVRRFADGGTIGAAQPQIAKAGGAGILWAEEGAGPWEAFISGHPGKRSRSRAIASDTVERLGGRVEWRRFADGGFYGSGGPSVRSEEYDQSLNAEVVNIYGEPRTWRRSFDREKPYRAKARPGRGD